MFKLLLSCNHGFVTNGRDGKLGPLFDGPYTCPDCGESATVMLVQRSYWPGSGPPPLG